MKTVLLAILAIALSACTVVSPIRPSTAPGYDGQVRDSGIIGVLPERSFLVTGYVKANFYSPAFRSYWVDFTVAITDSDVVFEPKTGTTFLIKDRAHKGAYKTFTADPHKSYFSMDAHYMTKYLDMCDWDNSGIDPTSIDPHQVAAPVAAKK